MNFLAHALLAGDLESDRVGGMIGDFVKGSLPAGLSPPLAAGVALHRAIDSFADRHPAFAASRARVSPPRRRLAGVLVDLFYDHLLARDWNRHARGSLSAYTGSLYAALKAHAGSLPPNANEVIVMMSRNDWLGSYRDLAAVGRAIDRMAIHRLRQPNTLGGGVTEFAADADGFAADFEQFLPDAIEFARRWRERREDGPTLDLHKN